MSQYTNEDRNSFHSIKANLGKAKAKPIIKEEPALVASKPRPLTIDTKRLGLSLNKDKEALLNSKISIPIFKESESSSITKQTKVTLNLN